MADLFRDILRIHREPYRYLDERTVHRRLTRRPRDYLRHLDRALRRIAAGRATLELPPKNIFQDPDGRGDFRVMPCVVRDGRRVTKSVKVVGTDVRGRKIPDQVTVGKVFCLDPRENFITHVIEGCLFSSARTGACAALAASRLAPEARRARIVGAGRVGFYSALYLSAIGVRGIEFQDRMASRAAAAQKYFRRMSGEPDLLVLATTSRTPLCDPRETTASIVISVGADCIGQRELGQGWQSRAGLWVDAYQSLEVGDLQVWRSTRRQIRGDLLDLYRSAPGGGRHVFISTGSALMDNLTASYLLS
jgi:ornithine cyclodeaminase/alanine dehydrogenase-like protein (mu-crystallin family)